MLQELTVCLSVHLCCRGTARSEAVRLFHVYGCKHLFFFFASVFYSEEKLLCIAVIFPSNKVQDLFCFTFL